ncbi:MAG TPA: hypothetical protein VH560_00260, partial [Polyangia bacterium]|nr:hypothetical protein [Polyangia bacterium]
ALIGAVLGQPRPVIVAVDTATELESAFLRLWDELWPGAKARFSLCTGALMPRTVTGVLMDIQAVPRAVPSSQFRKIAGTALVVDLRRPTAPDAWVDVLLEGASRGDSAFRSWMEAAVGAEASRGAVPSLMPIFAEMHGGSWSAPDVLASVLGMPQLELATRTRLVRMLFDRAGTDEGPAARRELLQTLCGHRDADLSFLSVMLEEQTHQLFEESRPEGCALTMSLLGAELTSVGEQVLRAAVLSLTSSDVGTFADSQVPFLPTIVSANPRLATAPEVWRRAGHRSREIIGQLDAFKLADEERSAVVDAVIASGADAPVEALVRFAGDAAVSPVLSAITKGELSFSAQWRSSLAGRPDAVLAWLEGHAALRSKELEVASRFVSPTTHRERLSKVWQTGISGQSDSFSPRVAAFGLALALGTSGLSPLFTTCFQPTFDALASSRLEYEEWDWLRQQAPPLSWWRDWDKCERIAAGLARRLKGQNASLETVFNILRGRGAIRKVVAVLDDDRDTRTYLKSLRKSLAVGSSVGTREQRDALMDKL